MLTFVMASRCVIVKVTRGVDVDRRSGREGLRAALGVARGLEGHVVKLVFVGAGVSWLTVGFSGLQGEERALWRALLTSETQLYACEVSLKKCEHGPPVGDADAICDAIRRLDADALARLYEEATVELVY